MYNNNHKYFLQYVLKTKCIPLEKALTYCKTLKDVNIKNTSDLKEFLSEINANICKQALKISIAKCEVTGNVSVILLGTASDDISKLQNNHSAVEHEYFQALLKELVTVDGHKVRVIRCFNLTSLRKDNVEKLLAKWTNEGYLVQCDENICLGVRCIMEFAPYFSVHCKEYYQFCNLCSEGVFIGRTCSNCSKLMHKHCMTKYLQKQEKCPNCKKPWQDAEQNGAVENDSDSEDPEQNGTVGNDSDSEDAEQNGTVENDSNMDDSD